MVLMDYSALDRKDISMRSFYPRRIWTPTPDGVEDHTITVDDGVSLSCRFFPAGRESATILFFYGNGEASVDYDGIAPYYNQIEANFFVADYRGYGQSGGFPTFTGMLSDARKVLDGLRAKLQENRYTGGVFVMGRSMGRHPAFELAVNSPDGISGLIIESGRPSLGQFVNGLDPSDAHTLEAAYQAKVRSISIPTLVIHGELDSLAPVGLAESMYQSLTSQDKRMVTIPGAGHNDLLQVGFSQYFAAIRDFISP